MKELKYIKLFEAFQSIKLSKTLKFVDKDYRKSFLFDVERMFYKNDFPLSEISDDLFEYLPLRKALAFHKDPVEKKCGATSEGEFGSVGISGEKCQDGKLKRSWGAGRIRVMECPHCNGTGIEPFKPKWRYIKFWFNTDGEYITKTATNGSVYGDGTSPYKYDRLVNLSYGSVEPRDWYGWREEDIQRELKSANFALILDLDKLEKKSKKVKSTEVTKQERKDIKRGALALQSHVVIKEQNIRRYFEQIIKRSKFSIDVNFDEIKNVNKLINRFLCGQYALFAINPSSDVDSMRKINSVGETIYDIMYSVQKDSSQLNKNSLISKIDSLNRDIENYLNSLDDYKSRIKRSLDSTRNLVDSSDDKTPSKIFNNLMQINTMIYEYVSKYKVETLYDYETLLADLTTITELMSQKRYLHNLNGFFDRVASRWSYSDAMYYLTNNRLSKNDLELALEGTERFIDFLKNRYSM